MRSRMSFPILTPRDPTLARPVSQLVCQPLDTIKVRMQLSKSGRVPGVSVGFDRGGCRWMTDDLPLDETSRVFSDGRVDRA
jgi:hypothetical protein